MIGAIYGDIIGSLYEEVPHLPKRTKMTPTDDSFLTCACKEWAEDITPKECSEYLITNKNADLLEKMAIQSLKRWWSYFPEQGFSRGFNIWAKDPNPPKGNRNTNGCLMRNSPIVPAMIEKSIYLRHDIISLAKVFACVTHNHPDALQAVELHTEMIFLGCMNELNKNELKKILLSTDTPSFMLKPLSYWKEQSEFIWDAPRSLSIAVSAIMEADSYREAIDNCCKIGKDADTYAAIAGPIAQTIWGIDTETETMCNKLLEDFPQIKKIYNL